MTDYEHQPQTGPGLWVGAGLLILVAGLSLLFVQLSSDGGDGGGGGLGIAGGVLALAGLVAFVAGLRQLIRGRRRDG